MQGGSTRPSGAPDSRGDILSRIVETKRGELSSLTGRVAELRSRAGDAEPPRAFGVAVARRGTVSLIAEVKRRSPGAGSIRPDLDPVALAREYSEAGAEAISVLTDRHYFHGSLEDLAAVRAAVPIPVLRKDFTLGEAQVWEARAAGADAILLIVGILEDGALLDFRLLAEELGMAVLVEVHDRPELERALASGVRILGINNRDLRSFTTSIETTLNLLPRVPAGVTLVSESGIQSREDVERLGGKGVDAVLVGESLLRAPDPREKARELVGIRARSRSGDGGPRRLEAF